MNDLTKAEIKQRLRAAGLSWACSWDGDGEVLPREDHVAQADYDAAAAIVAATLAEGERRYKTGVELWEEYDALPAEAQACWDKALVVVLSRVILQPDSRLTKEVVDLSQYLLGRANPELLGELAAEGGVGLTMTTTDPAPDQEPAS